MFAIYICCFIFCCMRPVHSDVFSAVADLVHLVPIEQELIDLLGIYIKSEDTNQNLLRRYHESFQKSEAEDAERYVSNPINAFTLIKRLVIDWEEIEALIMDEETLDKIASIKDTEWFPDDEDLFGAALAIIRLQETYNLSTFSLAKGEISGTKYGPGMSASDCFELGKVLYKAGDHDNAQKWMLQAKQRLELEDQPSLDHQILEDYLTSSFLKKRIIRPALAVLDKLMEAAASTKGSLGKVDAKPKDQEKPKNLDYLDAIIKYDKKFSETFNSSFVHNLIYELCRGNVSPAPQQLRCYYHNNSPSLLIGPIKVEELYSDPDIIAFHDVLTEGEMDEIKKLSILRKLTRAKVVGSNSSQVVADYRVSKHVGFKGVDSQLMNDLTKRIEIMTGLSMETAESLTVVNYGIGGYYGAHFDGYVQHLPANDTRGDRVATLMFYLSDVELGGATIFPFINLAVKPRKGSAILWYNFLSSGDIDKYTVHSACPVLLGSKWVATRWIRERAQVFRRPCNLERPPSERLVVANE